MTTTDCAPTLANAEAGICALSCVEFTKVVGSACPLNKIPDPETKLVPLMVRVTAPLFWITKAGATEDIVGSGLEVTAGGIAEKIDTVLML